MATIGAISVAIKADTTRFTSGLNKARRQMSGFAKAGAVFGLVGVGVGAAIGAVKKFISTLRDSFRVAEEFNIAMSKSVSIMGDVSAGLRKEMRATAIEVSKTSTASASQAADAYFFLASAGLTAEQAIAALPQVTRFATAGMFDLATATDLATDAQSALGLTVKDPTKNLENLTRVTDVLIKANTLANATAQQFSEALTNKAGASLKVVGKDIEEGVAVLAAFADQGVKGAEAGTQFGIVMRDLQTKALANSDTFKAFGISVFDADGEMRHMAQILADVEAKLAGMSDATKKQTLLTLGFSDKSVSAIQVLLGMSEKIAEYDAKLRAAGGTTKEVADKMLTPMQKTTAELGAAWQKFSDQFATTIGPVVLVGLMALTKLLEGVAEILSIVNTAFGQMADGLGFGAKSGIKLAGPDIEVTSSLDLTPTQPSGTELNAVGDNVKKDGERMAAEFATPLQKYTDRQAEIQKLFDAGVIDFGTFTRANKSANEDYQSAIGDTTRKQERAADKIAEMPKILERQLPQALRFGTGGAASFIRRQSMNDPQKQLVKVNQDQLAEQKRIADGIASLNQNLAVQAAFI